MARNLRVEDRVGLSEEWDIVVETEVSAEDKVAVEVVLHRWKLGNRGCLPWVVKKRFEIDLSTVKQSFI